MRTEVGITRRLAGLLLGMGLFASPVRGDLRSTEILRHSCTSESGRREVTLFANGTVRLREGPWDGQELYLGELSPEALRANLRVLRNAYSERPLDQIRRPLGPGPGGSRVERCEILLALPAQQDPLRYEYTSYDVPPLAVSRLIHIADELAEHARPIEWPERLPDDYEPRFGDVLRTAEGVRFRVLRLTTDGRGMELEGVDEPLRIFVALEDLGEVFVALEKDDETWWRP